MARGFITDGMTVSEIINMPYDTKMSMNAREMRHALALVNNMANKRLDRLNKASRKDPTIDTTSTRTKRFKTPKNLNDMRAEMKRAKAFIESKTSTITGARESFYDKQARITNTSTDEYKKQLQKELNERQKLARREALKEKRKKAKRPKDKRKVKLTDRQKDQVNKRVEREFYDELRNKTNEIYELFNKYNELNRSDAFVKGSSNILEMTHDVYTEHPEMTTMEKLEEIERRLQNEYEMLQQEELRREKEAAEKFKFTTPLF